MNKKFAWFKNFSILITFSTNLSSETSSLIQIPRNNNLFVLQLISKYLPENPIIIEAGAFNGSDSLVMSNFWPKGTIYAFEPAPELYQLIVKRIKDKSNIFAFEYALSDKNGIANFYLSAKTNSPKHTSSSSSLLPPTEKMQICYPQLIFNKEITVPVITLDTWCEQNNIDHIDMLWLDMQGYELNMILASPRILQTVQAIYIEVEFKEIYQGQYLYNDIVPSLNNLGFTIVAKDFKGEGESGTFGNVLFIKNLALN